MVIERAHRIGPTRPEPNSRPRMVIFKTPNFIHKVTIWLASRRQKEIRWDGKRNFISSDYSSEVTRARKEFSGLCSRLVKENRKFALLYPARLRLFGGNNSLRWMMRRHSAKSQRTLKTMDRSHLMKATDLLIMFFCYNSFFLNLYYSYVSLYNCISY